MRGPKEHTNRKTLDNIAGTAHHGHVLLLWLLTAVLAAATENETSIFSPSDESLLLYGMTVTPVSEAASLTNASQYLVISLPTTLNEMSASTSVSETNILPTVETTTPERLGLHVPPRLSPVHHHYHQGSRWGPYFEEGATPQNITARVRATVRLDCKIGMLHDKTASLLFLLHLVTLIHNIGFMKLIFDSCFTFNKKFIGS